jgi:hypothetical protein
MVGRADTKINRGNERGASIKARAKPLDMSLTQFVEALAIADARRDYLALNDPIARKEAAGGRRTLQAGVSTHDARSRLRKILD